MPQGGASLALHRPVVPMGTGGTTCLRRPPDQESQNQQSRPPTRPPTGRSAPTGTRTQLHRTTPLPRPRSIPPTQLSQTPTNPAVLRHPGPAPTLPNTHHTGTTALKNAHRGRRSRRARECGTTTSTSTPPPSPAHAPWCRNTTATPYSSIITKPQQPGTAGQRPIAAHWTAPPQHACHGHTYHHHGPLPSYPPVPWCHTQPAHPHHHHHTV